MPVPVCKECGRKAKSFNVSAEHNGKVLSERWATWCPNVLHCKLARSGFQGHGKTRDQARDDFNNKQNDKDAPRSACSGNKE